MGRRLLILGLRFGALEVHFDVLLWPWDGPWTCFSAFPEKSRKRSKKEAKKGAEIESSGNQNKRKSGKRAPPKTVTNKTTKKHSLYWETTKKYGFAVFWLHLSAFGLPGIKMVPKSLPRVPGTVPSPIFNRLLMVFEHVFIKF